jgi:hypothetical protein
MIEGIIQIREKHLDFASTESSTKAHVRLREENYLEQIIKPPLFMGFRNETVKCVSDRVERSEERRRHTGSMSTSDERVRPQLVRSWLS